MNKGLLGIPGGGSGNFGRAVRYGPFPVVPNSSVVLGNPFGRNTIIAVTYECIRADLGWPVGSLVQEWLAAVAANGHGIQWGRDQVRLTFATNVRLPNKSTSAMTGVTAGSWLAWVSMIG